MRARDDREVRADDAMLDRMASPDDPETLLLRTFDAADPSTLQILRRCRSFDAADPSTLQITIAARAGRQRARSECRTLGVFAR